MKEASDENKEETWEAGYERIDAYIEKLLPRPFPLFIQGSDELC